MQVKLAVVADHANVSSEGKLNILGIFDRIVVSDLPAVHPQMHLIVRLEAHPAERDRPHPVEVRLHDPDGQTVFELKGEVVPEGLGLDEAVFHEVTEQRRGAMIAEAARVDSGRDEIVAERVHFDQRRELAGVAEVVGKFTAR